MNREEIIDKIAKMECEISYLKKEQMETGTWGNILLYKLWCSNNYACVD